MQVTKFNLVTDLQIMLSNVTHSNLYFECNTERGSIDQLYIELGVHRASRQEEIIRFRHIFQDLCSLISFSTVLDTN